MIDDIQEIIKNYTPKFYKEQTEAAVFIPLIEVKGEWHILYEVRSKNVSQAGDSSFPGGHVEKNEDFIEAAVRETMEELNIKREQIEVFGEMDYIVNRNIKIHSFVGKITGVTVDEIYPNEEVETIYTIPLSYFLRNEPKYFTVHFKPEFEGRPENSFNQYQLKESQEKIPYYEIDNHSLWGFTANLTANFIKLIKNEFPLS